MAKMLTVAAKRDLTARRRVTIELPGFLLSAFEHRLAQANADAPVGEDVTLDHLVELELAESLSLGEVILLEADLPGIREAVNQWLSEID